MHSDYHHNRLPSRRALTNTRTDTAGQPEAHHAAQDEQQDDVENPPFLQEMASLLEFSPTGTGPLFTIDQFSMGPVMGYDQFETMVMEAVRPRNPAAEA